MNDITSNKYENLTFKDYLSKTFIIMSFGIVVSLLTSIIMNYFLKNISHQFRIALLVSSIIIELIIATLFSSMLFKMTKRNAWICYFIYCITTGIFLSMILETYTLTSAIMAFLSAEILFICMAIIGHTTKIDITKYSSLLFGGLISILIISIINIIFIHNNALDTFICYAGILTFLGLIAYDTRKLRDLYNNFLSNNEIGEKILIYGAFTLYLDFINLFLRLLSLLGKRKD